MYGPKNSPTAADSFDTCNGGTDGNKTRRVPIRPTCSSQVFEIGRCVRDPCYLREATSTTDWLAAAQSRPWRDDSPFVDVHNAHTADGWLFLGNDSFSVGHRVYSSGSSRGAPPLSPPFPYNVAVVGVSVVAAAVTAAASCGYGLLTRQVAHAAFEWKTTGNSRPPATHRVGKVEVKKLASPFSSALYLPLFRLGE